MFEVYRCKRDLAVLARQLPMFDWPAMEKRMRAAVETLYTAWGKGDLSPAAEYVTASFFQSQQDLIARWAEEGKQNVFQLHDAVRVAPLYIRVEDAESLSVVGVRIKGSATDFLLHTDTGKVLKGKRDKDTLENVVYFVYADGEWLLNSIEEGSQTLAVASMKNQLDASYLLDMARATTELAGTDPAQHPRPAQAKAARCA